MAAAYIEEIRRLARCFRPNERNLSLYFPDFDTPPPPGSVNQVFGPPFGMTDAQWPTCRQLAWVLRDAGLLHQWDHTDLRMEHVFTIDLRGTPVAGVPRGAQAMQLYLSNATVHGADHAANNEAVVVFLGREHLARGAYRGHLPDRSRQHWSRRFTLQRVDVPGDVFDPPEDDAVLAELQDAIWQAPARLGGCPIWLREPRNPRDLTPTTVKRPPRPGLPGRDAFVMQFDRRFADVALGAHGIMYVSGVGAYYQSYDQGLSFACSG